MTHFFLSPIRVLAKGMLFRLGEALGAARQRILRVCEMNL